MITTSTSIATAERPERSRPVNPYSPTQLAGIAEARALGQRQRNTVRCTTIAARYSVAGQGRMLAGVAHKAIQSYLADTWDAVTAEEREQLQKLLPDLDALCGFSPLGGQVGQIAVAAARSRWGVADRYCSTGGVLVGWMIQISPRLFVWLAPISAAHVDDAEDDDEVTLSNWTFALRNLIRTGHDLYIGPFSRLGRRKAQLMTIALSAAKNGSRIRTAEYEFDWRPDKPDPIGINDLLWTQFASMQESEWRAILERTFAGRVLALRDGRLPTHSPCWGWTKDAEGRPVPDESEMAIVRLALRLAAKYGPGDAEKLINEWHVLGVGYRRHQPRDEGRTLLDVAAPSRVRYIRARLADLITYETGRWRWYAPTVLEDLELVHGVELLPDVLDPRRRIAWFDISHPFPQSGALVSGSDAAKIRERWEPKPCGECYDCLRERWCHAGTGETQDSWFGFNARWTDDDDSAEYRITLRSDSGDREPGVIVLSRPVGSNALWYPVKGQLNADRMARVPSDEYCNKLRSAIVESAGGVLSFPAPITDEDPGVIAAAALRRKLTTEIEHLKRATQAVEGAAQAAIQAAVQPQIDAKEAQLSTLMLTATAAVPPTDEADITALATTVDVLAGGDLKTPQRTTSMIRGTLRNQRATVSGDQQWVTFTAELTVPSRSGAAVVHKDAITWTCRNSTFEAQMTRSQDRTDELVRRILREGSSLNATAAAMTISAGTAMNKFSGAMKQTLPNIQARGAIAVTPYLPSRQLIADLRDGVEPDGPAWLRRAVAERYCAVPGGNRCASMWVARGHAWRRELHLYMLRAGEPVSVGELAQVPWRTFVWGEGRRNQARSAHASWPGFLTSTSPGVVELLRCEGCDEPYDLLLNVPELSSPLVCTRCRRCAGETFEIPEMLLKSWDVSTRHSPAVVTVSAPARVVAAK